MHAKINVTTKEKGLLEAESYFKNPEPNEDSTDLNPSTLLKLRTYLVFSYIFNLSLSHTD